jgi:hypothetical protein
MAHNLHVALVTIENMMNQMLVLCAAGGSIKLYTGLKPGRGGGPIPSEDIMLVSLEMSSPAFGYASSGVSTANVITPGIPAAEGKPTWFRMYQADGVTPILDGTAGVGSSYDLNITNASIVFGTEFFITSFVVNQPIGNPFMDVAPGVANQMLNWIANYTNNGFIYVYSGTQPASADDAIPGGDVLLATLDLGNPAISSIVDGELISNPVSGAGTANGTPTWFRMLESDMTPILDGSAGFGGAYDLVLGSVAISVGQRINVVSFNLVQN